MSTSEQKARTTPLTQTRERKATTARRRGCSRATMPRMWILVGTVLTFVGAPVNAWVFLVEILR